MIRTLTSISDKNSVYITVNWKYENGTNDQFTSMLLQEYFGMIDTCKSFGPKGTVWDEDPGAMCCVFKFTERKYATMFALVWK